MTKESLLTAVRLVYKRFKTVFEYIPDFEHYDELIWKIAEAIENAKNTSKISTTELRTPRYLNPDARSLRLDLSARNLKIKGQHTGKPGGPGLYIIDYED